MRVVTSNIKCNPKMRQSYVESDIRRVRELGDVILWQEIEIPRYKQAVRQHAATPTASTAPLAPTYELGQECPISIVGLEDWAATAGSTRLMHKGRMLTTPNRYCSVVETTRPDGLLVAFMNTHYVSGAWNDKRKLNKKWRQRMWLKHWVEQKQWIHELLAAGYTVIGGGDFNRVNVPAFHPNQIDLAHSGIDKLFVIPAQGVTAHARLQGRHYKGLHTDHPAVVGWVSLHKHAKVGA